MLMWLFFVGVILVDGILASYPVIGCVMAFVGTFAAPVKNITMKLRGKLVLGTILCLVFGKFFIIKYIWAAFSLFILRSVAVCVKKYEAVTRRKYSGAAIMSIWNMYAVLSASVYILRFFNHSVLAVLPAVFGFIAEIGYIFSLYTFVSKIAPFPGFRAILNPLRKRPSI